MNLLNQIKYWLGDIPIPSTLSRTQPYLLHLFDTHSYTFMSIEQLLTKLNIVAVVHSGNLCRQINLATNPELICIYEQQLAVFSKALLLHDITDVYISLGPTDHFQSIKRVLPLSQLVQDCGEFNLYGQRFSYGYDKQQQASHLCTIKLYSRKDFRNIRYDNAPFFGFFSRSYIELINLETAEVHKLPVV